MKRSLSISRRRIVAPAKKGTGRTNAFEQFVTAKAGTSDETFGKVIVRSVEVGSSDNISPTYSTMSVPIYSDNMAEAVSRGALKECMAKPLQQVLPTEGTVGFD